jgi:hypothetical protein
MGAVHDNVQLEEGCSRLFGNASTEDWWYVRVRFWISSSFTQMRKSVPVQLDL